MSRSKKKKWSRLLERIFYVCYSTLCTTVIYNMFVYVCVWCLWELRRMQFTDIHLQTKSRCSSAVFYFYYLRNIIFHFPLYIYYCERALEYKQQMFASVYSKDVSRRPNAAYIWALIFLTTDRALTFKTFLDNCHLPKKGQNFNLLYSHLYSYL